jgi:hypothetical protein
METILPGAPPGSVQRYLDNVAAGQGQLLLLLQTKECLRQDEEAESEKMEEFLKKRCEAQGGTYYPLDSEGNRSESAYAGAAQLGVMTSQKDLADKSAP